MSDKPLSELSDEELGKKVRQTPTFRAAVACADIAESVGELRDNTDGVYDRLLEKAYERQSRVGTIETTEDQVNAFLDVIEEHGKMAQEPEEVADEGADEVVDT